MGSGFRLMGSGLWWQLRCKIYICGEAATTISHFSFKRGFKWNQRATRPHGYPRTPNPEPRTLNPEPRTLNPEPLNPK